MRNQKFRGNVFVTNLPAGTGDEQLASHFDEYGIVLAAMVARDAEDGSLKNYGLVSIAPEKAAAAAIAELDGTVVDGKRLRVRAADPDMGLRIPTRRAPPRHTQWRPPPPVEHTRRPVVVERLPSRRRSPMP